ncbi:phosphopantetheine-binding protein [Streptomyces sp. ST2-7A]|uniref:phosphopantetheine-binding protein n=1 Tax=Streptomyces sp. ST2-7A TaxID=2907214 RepID=UPI001F386337|nr:phosphopantetheine-binding protein [Streptomyces sp. ST2-7A]MCE7081103.1 phosphopantetheine-binding protein [Streptomyces sp. ST2-7A]
MRHEQLIKRFLVDEFLPDTEPADLDPDYDLTAGGVVDSLGLLKIIAWLEHRFDLVADELELDPESFRTVRAIDAFVRHAAARDLETN